MISLIWAMDKNGLIGKDNKLPWHLPKDLEFFKKTTLGKTIIMGRKTFESFKKPLPKRHSVILTRSKNYHADMCTFINSVEEAIDLCKDEEVFIIGGSEIYKLFLPIADKLYITFIQDEFEGDTYFPKIDWNKWELVSKTKVIKDKENPYDFTWNIYIKKQTSNN